MRIQAQANLYEKLYMRTNEFNRLNYQFENFNVDWIEGDSEHRGYWKISFNQNIYYVNKDNQDEFRIYTDGFTQWGCLISIYYGYETEELHFDCSILLQDNNLEKYIESVIQNRLAFLIKKA
tara:strand:- start:2185 stop:2550 length:366 start_codon:yes stop_codon:yes gene_type:complete